MKKRSEGQQQTTPLTLLWLLSVEIFATPRLLAF
jgi:hypothetical protein